MGRRFLLVEDSFLIKGRGLVVLPGLAPQGDERFRVGDPITLKRPTARISVGRSAGSRSPRVLLQMRLLMLLKGLSREDVPIGTEVWSVDA